MFAGSAAAVDWSQPWREPQESGAAATSPDEYAWRLFVAVNWPAGNAVHAAGATQSLGTDGAAVWENWKNAKEVYLDGALDPGAWDVQPASNTAVAAERFETLSLKEFARPRHIEHGVMVLTVDPIAAAKFVTEIRLNRATFEFIRAQRLYDLDEQVKRFRDGTPVTFPVGAKEIKARWRPISEAEKSRYHTLRVTLADGSVRLYGLTALHILSKDLPNWFWATFEHVDNATLPGSEGWLLKSADAFACGSEPADCNRAPAGIGLEGTVWQNYRLRGTLTSFTDAQGQPRILASSQLEARFQATSSCITCHARASVGVVDGHPSRLAVFQNTPDLQVAGGQQPVAFVGEPRPEWFYAATSSGRGNRLYLPLDFVWSLSKAHSGSQRDTVQ